MTQIQLPVSHQNSGNGPFKCISLILMHHISRVQICCLLQTASRFRWEHFTASYLKGKSLAIACPKLDQDTDSYIEKLTGMIDIAKVNTITVMMMEVPCCGGLLQMVIKASGRASRKVPVKKMIVGLTEMYFRKNGCRKYELSDNSSSISLFRLVLNRELNIFDIIEFCSKRSVFNLI